MSSIPQKISADSSSRQRPSECLYGVFKNILRCFLRYQYQNCGVDDRPRSLKTHGLTAPAELRRSVLRGILLRFRFDAGGIGTVAKSKHRRDNEEGLYPHSLPDPSPEKGNQYRDHVVDGNSG